MKVYYLISADYNPVGGNSWKLIEGLSVEEAIIKYAGKTTMMFQWQHKTEDILLFSHLFAPGDTGSVINRTAEAVFTRFKNGLV